MSNEEVMIPKSYHDKVCEEIIRFKDKQFYDAVHLLDDGTLEITVGDYTKVKRVLVEDDNNFGNLFCEDKADRPQGEWINKHEWANGFYERECSICGAMKPQLMHTAKINFCPNCGCRMKGADDETIRTEDI